MKRFLSLIAAALLLTSCGVLSNLNSERLLQGGVYAIQALTLSDEQVEAYVSQYIAQLDAQSKVLPESSPYTKRLRKLTANLDGVNEKPLNFKVYQQDEVNAFACADGSVRVYTGIMDAMTDNELLGVIGHEMGHVALHHTRKQMQKSMLTSAALQGIASAGDKIAALTDSQLGALGEVILNAKFSRDMETEADDYGYNYLCEAGKNPWSMVQSFEKLQKLSSGTAAQASAVSNLFSSHPDTQSRIEHISQRCLQDGYKRPTK
ncbi:MAG: M48 family metallopeptidase [Bacteroidales bacterium]|nr:M48 family metallopeptidase [Bacteroidales bacterium]